MGGKRRAPGTPVLDTTHHRVLSSTSRAGILELVRASGAGMTAAEVAEERGLHTSTVRAHLEQLTSVGLLTREPARGGTPGRPAWRYRAITAPGPADSLYRDLAGALVGHLARAAPNPASAGEQAGRDWGRRLVSREVAPREAVGSTREAPLDGLVRVLDHLGFTPSVQHRDSGPSAEVHLRTCPFLDLVGSNQDVVCGLHLGVIRGALGGLGASTAGTTLEPFGAEGACVVRIRSTAVGGDGTGPDESTGDNDVPRARRRR